MPASPDSITDDLELVAALEEKNEELREAVARAEESLRIEGAKDVATRLRDRLAEARAENARLKGQLAVKRM